MKPQTLLLESVNSTALHAGRQCSRGSRLNEWLTDI
jgi:hypothetical protein